MGYLVVSFYSNWLTILDKILGKIPPDLVLLYENCTLILKHFFLSKHSVLFPRLIDRCFITFFQRAFLTVTLRAKTVKNALFLVFKIRKYDWLIDSFIHWFSMQVVSHDSLYIVTSLQVIQSITNNQTLDNVKIPIHKVYLATIL